LPFLIKLFPANEYANVVLPVPLAPEMTQFSVFFISQFTSVKTRL